ncbi:MAG: STAS domain-containing protein [bacterium]
MKFTIEERDNIILIRMEGDVIGGPDAATISEKIRDFLSQGKKKFIIDLKSVRWMNSSGLGVLIGCLTTVRNNQGKLILLHIPTKVKELLKLTKLERVFQQFENEDTAIENFKEK